MKTANVYVSATLLCLTLGGCGIPDRLANVGLA